MEPLLEKKFNRLFAWESALSTAQSYMTAAHYIEEIDRDATGLRLQSPYYREWQVDGGIAGMHVLSFAIVALHTSAIVLFFQMFTRGDDGPRMADNFDEEIKGERDRIVDRAKGILDWDDGKYDSLFNSLRAKRHQLLAHYDGTAAGDGGGIKLPYPGMDVTVREDFLNLLNTMRRVIVERLQGIIVNGKNS